MVREEYRKTFIHAINHLFTLRLFYFGEILQCAIQAKPLCPWGAYILGR
jgi:hypothetical protein